MTFRTRLSRTAFRAGRLLFGGMLAYAAYDSLTSLNGRITYAQHKDVPVPEVLVPLGSAALLFGSIAITLWRLPRLAAASVIAFLVGTTPQMHDFWNASEENRSGERNHFIKNLALLGGALFVLAIASQREE